MKNIFTLSILLLLGVIYSPLQGQTYEIGTGTNVNTSTSYPSPYGNYYYGSKEQYIIRASELWAAGASGGNINSLAFNVATPSGVSLVNYTISIGTTTDSVLSGTFLGNLTQVYSNSSYTDVTGWNTHTFSSPFAWDGTSNIVIETCFNNSSYESNGQVYYSTTNYNSTINYHADQSGVCSNTYGSQYSQRPNMKLGISNPNPNNLWLSNVVSPNIGGANNPSSSFPVQIEVRNPGTATQAGFTLGYSIDGGSNYVTETYNDSLHPGDTLYHTFSTPANLSTNGVYPCQFFVANSGDQFTGNDTIYIGVLVCQSLSGTYTAGGTGADFQTLSDAANVLNSCGISGPVTIKINSGTYNEAIEFGPITGASATNTITLTSSTGNRDDVLIQSSDGQGNSGIMSFNGAKHFIVKDISVEYNGTSSLSVLSIANNSDSIQFLGNKFISAQSSGEANVNIENANNILIRNNMISNGYMGIRVFGDYSVRNENIIIDSNQVLNFGYYGIYVYYTNYFSINHNQIEQMQGQSSNYGIYTYYGDGIEIIGNTINIQNTSTCYGMRVSYTRYGVSDTAVPYGIVANNMINLQSSSTIYGAYTYYNNGLRFVHNTIKISGSSSSSSRALYQYNSTSNQDGEYYYNNIFAVDDQGYAAYFSSPTSLMGLDYNNYYLMGTSSNFIYYSGNRIDLAAYKSASGKDSNSVSLDPAFFGANNLHSASLTMADLGTPLSYISTDIDGDTRSSSTPDMGADEYMPPQNNVNMINLYAIGIDDEPLCDLSANEQLVVEFVNKGALTQTSVPVKFKLDQNTVVSETWTGSLATGDTASHTFTSALNLSQAGEHNLIAYTDLSGDENNFDDSLNVKFNTFTSVSIPHNDDFEGSTNLYYHLESKDQATVVWDNIHGYNSASALYFTGQQYYSEWYYTGSDLLSNIANNSEHMAKVTLCPIDATSLSALRMSFDFEQNFSDTYSSFFFVRINDSLYAKTLDGDSVFTQSDWENLTFDLSPYTGSYISIELCGILRTNEHYYGYSGNVDDITIDNLRLFVPKNNDVAPINIYGTDNSDCGSETDSIYVVIKNMGLLAQNNIPVTVNITWGANIHNWTVTYTDTLQPEESEDIFVGTLNTSINGALDLELYTSLSTDENRTNDTMKLQGYQEIYKTIPFVADFESQDYDWNMNNFWRQDMSYFGSSGYALMLEKYFGGENIAPPGTINSINNYDGYAEYDERIGEVTENTYLVYDYNFVSKNGSYTDSVVFVINTDCEDINYQSVSSIHAGSAQNTNTWYREYVPLGQFAGNTVNLALYYRENYSQSGFMLAIDNISIINSTPIDLGNDTTLCGGETLTLQTGLSSQYYNFSWQGPGVSTSDTNASLTVNTPGTYTVSVTDSLGMVSTDNIIVNMHPTLNGYLSILDSVLCFGDSTEIMVNLSGTLPIVFNWTDGNSSFSDTADNHMVSRWFDPASTTNYTLTSLVDSNGCTATVNHNRTVTVNSLPSVSASGLLADYCFNDPNDTLIGLPSGGTFTGMGMMANAFSPSNAGDGMHQIVYSYTDNNGCVNTDTLNTQVHNNPVVSIVSPVQSSYCDNATPVVLYAFPSGGTFTGNGISGNVLSPSMANPGLNTITYSFTDSHNCSATDDLSFTLNVSPSVSISTSLAASYCVSDNSISLVASPSGGSFTGNGVNGNNFDPANANIGGVEIVYNYSDANGCSGSDTVSTQVYGLPTALITTPFAAQYCQDGTIISLNGYPAGGTFLGNGVNVNTFFKDSVTPGNQSIVYAYTDGNGCTNSDTAEFVINALPSVSVSNQADVCADVNQISLSGGTPSGGSYSGNNVNTNSGVFYPLSAGVGLSNFVYSFTDANGCSNSDTAGIRVVGLPSAQFNLPATVCKSDTLNINYTGNASASAQFSWTFDNAVISSGTGVGPYTLKWDTAGIKAVSLTVTDSGCVSITQNNYTNVLDAIASISTVGGPSACYQDSVLMFANSGPGYSYQWFDTSGVLTTIQDTLPFLYALSTGSYYAEVTNNFGCKAQSNTIDATVYSEILADFTLPPTACKDAMVSITLNGTADTVSSYIWDFNAGMVASGSGSGPYSIIWNSNGQKEVKLQIEKYGCYSNITSKFIDIVTTPATITALGPTTFCDGNSVTLYPNSGANLSYDWFKDGASLSNTNNFFTANQSGQYSVKVTDTVLGCTNTSASVSVVANTTNFNLAFTANPTNFTIPPYNVNISNQTPDTSNYIWAWSWGDGNTSTMVNPSHQYQYTGTYTVGVIAKHIYTGCYDTLVKTDYITCTNGPTDPCSLVAAITPAGPKTICPGDTVFLTASNNHAGATYQWLKDGVLISGATGPSFDATTSGNYQVMVSDSICNRFSSPFSLSVYNTITPVIASNGSIMPCSNDSMELFVTSTFNSYLWSNGATGSNIFVKTSSNYTVDATDINGCTTKSAPYVVNASLLQKPEICIVGVDSATNNNFVVWERNSDPLIDSFRIYRESTVAGVYNLLGTQSVGMPGVFYDVNSNPKVQAYRYKISAVDTCGMETPMSDLHKTIHLSINAGIDSTWNLIWSHYEGFNFGSYRIYRGFDSTSLQLLTQIQSTLNSFTDLNPPSGNVYYQIEVVSPHPCYPDSIYTKAQTNYNTSRSNNVNTSAANPFNGITERLISDYSVNVYPNPNNGQFDFELISAKRDLFKLSIRNVLGQEVYQQANIQATGRYTQSLNLGRVAPGVYYMVIENSDSRLVKKIVIN
jgi:hypothetical protein